MGTARAVFSSRDALVALYSGSLRTMVSLRAPPGTRARLRGELAGGTWLDGRRKRL